MLWSVREVVLTDGYGVLGRWWVMCSLATTPDAAGALAVAWLRTKHNGASSTYNRHKDVALEDFRRAAEWGAETFRGTKSPPRAPSTRRSSRPQARRRHQVTEADVRRATCPGVYALWRR